MKKASTVFATRNRRTIPIILLGGIFIILTACAPKNRSLVGPTPIPTLIPVAAQPISFRSTEIPSLVIESYPAGLPSAMVGQTLYAEYCASCHGADGNGVVPNARNFGDVDYMRGETPANFYVIVTEGRGADMPAFGEVLTSDERWDVVYFVWRFSTSDAVLKDGEQTYTDNCASCHGEDGRSLILGAANFSDHRFMANQSPSLLYVSVTQGRGSMPAWQARLSQDERWGVIDYIRTFTYDPQIGTEVEIPLTETATEDVERVDCSTYQSQVNPFEGDDVDAITAGQSIYNSNCSSCHGEDGRGRLPGILDFTEPSTHAELRDNPIESVCIIAEGYQSMPAFKDKLTETEIWQLLVWLTTFGE